jgi:predicted nuclease of predicted toxin-antitoxin system
MPSLKFLLDADMPRSSAKLIRSLGYDVEDVRDIGLRGAKDEEIIKYALKTNRIIVTRNVGFGSTLRHPKHPGAIIIRLPYNFTPKEINGKLKNFLTSVNENEIKNPVIIVGITRYRRRTLQ